ncbi:ATP-binding cassette domain-containing protein [Streptomyces sp. R39]|uniref:ATP-binding cassette domain-containing protein n=1 Tax=Streptomyces sp. R39 TaxID=3238631 RepID=A0AB39QX63_9ACTN
MDEVIRCAGLTKRYGAALAVDGLDLTVGAGQVFGFLGPNGSGKTTTMRMLLGLVRPTSGRAWIHGRPLPDPDGLARVGAMIEEPGFHPWATGRRNLEYLALAGPAPRPDAVERVLARVELTEAADRKVKTYSQGMRQRLGLAAALLREPSLLVLDEPTNGLDPAGIQEMRSLLRELAAAGTTVFLSSHLLSEIEQVCDRVAVLHGGRLIEEGPVHDVARPTVRVTLDASDMTEAAGLFAGYRYRAAGPGRLLVEDADPREINQRLGQAGVWAHEVRREPGALENRFLSLTAYDHDGEGSDAPAAR